jgi:predicted dehydrogenase
MDTVRWGVIGAGDVCERKSGPPLHQVKNSAITLVHRRDEPAGRAFAARFDGARYVSDPDTFFDSDEIDAIYVATPHDLHHAHTVRALKTGKHVLVEKPMAMSTPDCDEMIRAAKKADRSLGVAYYRRGYPSIQKIRELIDERAIGTPESMSLNNEFPTSHRLDLVHFLLGDLRRVMVNKIAEGVYSPEDTVQKIRGETVGGAQISMATGWVETGMPEALRIVGSDGELYLQDLKGGEITLKLGARTEQLPMPGLPYAHWGLIDNFVKHLTAGVPLLCDGPAGRKSTAVLDALLAIEPGSGWGEVAYG